MPQRPRDIKFCSFFCNRHCFYRFAIVITLGKSSGNIVVVEGILDCGPIYSCILWHCIPDGVITYDLLDILQILPVQLSFMVLVW